MTLNITVAAHSLMAQSSDFLLTQKEQDGSRSAVHEAAQKQVVLHYMDWSGLVCYTGLASYDSQTPPPGWEMCLPTTRVIAHPIKWPIYWSAKETCGCVTSQRKFGTTRSP